MIYSIHSPDIGKSVVLFPIADIMQLPSWLVATMSIAISAIVKPSRYLHFLMYGMCLCITAVSGVIGFGLFGNFPFAARIIIAGVCVMCAWFALLHYLRQRKSFRIDISGIGQIRLVQYDDMRRTAYETDAANDGETVRLMEGSTLWSDLMILCLQSEGGQVTVLRILPDSVSSQEFRALSVACRWIAARMNEADNTAQPDSSGAP